MFSGTSVVLFSETSISDPIIEGLPSHNVLER